MLLLYHKERTKCLEHAKTNSLLRPTLYIVVSVLGMVCSAQECGSKNGLELKDDEVISRTEQAQGNPWPCP